MKLKVYGWQESITTGERDALGLRPWICQARAIVAAPSKAAAAGAAGYDYARSMFNLCDTGNAEEIKQARGEPGVVFLSSMDGAVALAGTGDWLARR